MTTGEQPERVFEQELFCTRFELGTLAETVRAEGSERWVPGFSSPGTEEQHVKRYAWACRFAEGKRVLDMACGVGRGSYLLAEEGHAESVLGVDLDANAVRYASIRNAHPSVSYRVGDAQSFLPDSQFDLVVGFETIEHLPDVPAYLRTVRAALNEKGRFLVSTPISKRAIDHHPRSAHHLIEWGMPAFAALLREYFVVEQTFVQVKKPPRNLLGRLVRALAKPAPQGFAPMVPIDAGAIGPGRAGLKGYQILVCRQQG